MKKNKLPKFVVLDHINKAALIDPDAGVFLGVSKKILNNLETEEVQNILYPIWQKQVEIQRKIASYHEGINTLYLMITRRCNMNCAFCAINANDLTCKQYELTISDIYEKVIPFIKECKPHKFILTGGEPLIKDNIVDIVNILHEEVDTHITLQSNGIAISKKIIEELKGNIQEIDFSTKHMFRGKRKRRDIKI
ncbi:MAG: radical SAM protein [Bacteroides faecis]